MKRFALLLSGVILLLVLSVNVWAQAPQKAQIAFTSNRDGEWGNHEIYVMDVNGKNQRNLTNNLAWDEEPAWSPDGKKIVFQSDRNGNYEIYVMDSNGNNQRNLTNNPALDKYPAWSPDGKKIAFTSSRNGNDEIYIMDVNGKNQHNLTNNPANDDRPSWFDPAFAHPVAPAGIPTGKLEQPGAR